MVEEVPVEGIKSRQSETQKLSEVHDEAQIIRSFIDWLRGRNLYVLKFDEKCGEWSSPYRNQEHIVCDFFGVDLDRLEAERWDFYS